MAKKTFVSVTIVFLAFNLYLWQQDPWSRGLEKVAEMISIIESLKQTGAYSLMLFETNHGVIVACDVDTLDAFETLVMETCHVDGVVGYKTG
ncbi:MAG: hypothetical protein R6V02_07865, partial [Candidatus Aminicenantes bacterium]